MNWTRVEELNNHALEKRWILNLPGAGCSWANKSGGCYMCNFKAATDKYTFGRQLPGFFFTGLYRFGHLLVKNQKPNSLIIFNGGSFLNDEEITLATQEALFNLVSRNNSIEKVIVESRPEYINDKNIRLLKKLLSKKELVIAIGLETKSESIRNKSINKGFSLKQFENAVETIKNNRAQLLTYVLLKPLFLTEKEAIDEAIKTIRYAFSIGSVEVDLEASSVIKGTKVETFYDKAEFRPPWLWSIIEVVNRTHDLGHLHIGGFEDNPPPKATPFNCTECSSQFPKLAKDFNKTQDFNLFKAFQCQCKNQWLKQLAI